MVFKLHTENIKCDEDFDDGEGSMIPMIPQFLPAGCEARTGCIWVGWYVCYRSGKNEEAQPSAQPGLPR